MFTVTKNLKRFVSISAAAVCMLASFNVAPVSDAEVVAAGDVLTAFEITEDMKVGWNLGNTMDAKAGDENGDFEHAGLETETAWGCPKANQTLFDALKAKGFNTVRIPTTWFQHLDADNNIDPAWLARVHEVVDYAYKNGMYVILNVHHENWINRPDLLTAYDDIKPKLLKIWSQLAEEFKDYDQHLIFECMNEPRAVGTSYEWWSATPVEEANVINKLNADFVELIRNTDGPYAKTRLLMLPGYVASSDKTFLKQIVMPDDDFLAVSIHAYTPYNFTMNTDESTGAYHDTFTKAFSNDLAYNLQNFRDIFISNGIPVVIGEMGTSNFGNTQARVEWTTQYFETTKKYGIPCVLWDNNIETNPDAPGECHAYINRETGQWLDSSLPIINKMMEIMNDSSIVWGSEGKKPDTSNVQHQDLSQGKEHISSPIEIDAAKNNPEDGYKNTTPGEPEISWDDVKGKEVAIKYTGDTPVLAFSDKDYSSTSWTELQPYAIDEKNGIAYYLVNTELPKAWDGELSNIKHMQARTDGVTTVEKMVILDAPKDVVVEEKNKIVKVSFAGADRSATLVVTVTGGTPGDTAEGCLGYMDGADWAQTTWNGVYDSEGKLTVSFPLSKVPADVQKGEFQMWSGFKGVEVKTEIVGSTETTSSSTSTSTTTTTTTTTTETFTSTTTETSTSTTTETSTSTTTTSSTTESTTSTTTTTNKVVADKLGDANCDTNVNMADAVLVMQSIANGDEFGVGKPDGITEQGSANADVYLPGSGLTMLDAETIQSYVMELITSLPVTEEAVNR